MTAVLNFNLPEDEHEYRMANDGQKWWLLVNAFSDWLREQHKYNDTLPEGQAAAYFDARARLYEMAREASLEIDQ